MDYKYTAYDRIIHITEKLPKDKISEAIEIIQEDSFQDLLDFCVEQNCFTQAQAITLYDFTIVFDSLDDNYHDFDLRGFVFRLLICFFFLTKILIFLNLL